MYFYNILRVNILIPFQAFAAPVADIDRIVFIMADIYDFGVKNLDNLIKHVKKQPVRIRI